MLKLEEGWGKITVVIGSEQWEGVKRETLMNGFPFTKSHQCNNQQKWSDYTANHLSIWKSSPSLAIRHYNNKSYHGLVQNARLELRGNSGGYGLGNVRVEPCYEK